MLNNFQSIHFVGIGGIGMSGLARILLSQGKQVSGSDIKANSLTDELSVLGAQVYIGHTCENIPEQSEYVVISTAISTDNPEIQEAQRREIPIIHRSEVLCYLLANSRGLSVTGTHGKTTTSALLALIVADQGLDPTLVIGGEVPQLGTNARAGSGEFTVAEVDESDQSLRNLSSEIAIVTNLEIDHLDHYHDLDEIIGAVLEFISHQPGHGLTVLNGDDSGCLNLQSRLAPHQACLCFGLHAAHLDYRATQTQLSVSGSTFSVEHKGQNLGQFELGIPGQHNIYNALSTIAVSHHLGFDLAQVAYSLKRYSGVKRRFQLMGELPQEIKIIDDYGHHPSEIEATLRTAKLQNRPITAVFQPHRYSRTQAFLHEFAQSFTLADRVILTDIYAASENPADFIVNIQDLVHQTQQANPGKEVLYFATLDEVRHFLWQNLIPQELILTIGAGDITKLSGLLLEKNRATKADEGKIVYAPLGLNGPQRQVV